MGVSSAGMKEQDYQRVTYDFTLAAANALVKTNPGMTFIYVSGAGTDSTEHGRSMWARVLQGALCGNGFALPALEGAHSKVGDNYGAGRPGHDQGRPAGSAEAGAGKPQHRQDLKVEQMDGRRVLALLLSVMIVLGGCTGRPTAPPEPPAEQAPPPEKEPESYDGLASPATLFPTTDLDMTFWVWDMDKPRSVPQTEQRIREGERLAIVQNGRPAFTWMIDQTGVWREDPAGGGVLLRYLPPGLKDGDVWSQQSGDATVWFHLRARDGSCSIGNGAGGAECWQLSVLNRGQETLYTLAPQTGPTEVTAVNSQKPGDSFLMKVEKVKGATLPPDQRAAVLEKASPRTTSRAPVTRATVADYNRARTAALSLETHQADLDGDGRPETLRGVLGAWTLASMETLNADGQLIASISVFQHAHKIDLVRLKPDGQTAAVVWQRSANWEPAVGLYLPLFQDGQWMWAGLYGWGVKHATNTPATRASWDEAGLLTIEWEMGDPARHTRIAQYRLDRASRSVSLTAERFVPQEKELRYPTDAAGVLKAAWTAHTYRIPDELPRYFRTPEGVEAFSQQARRPTLYSGITLGPPGPPPTGCPLPFTPGEPGPDGSATFLAGWPGLWYDEAWGTVKFSHTPEGRIVIDSFAIQKEQACSP